MAQDVPRVLVKLLLFGVLIGPHRENMCNMPRGFGTDACKRKGPAPVLVQARDASELRAEPAPRGRGGVQ